MHSLRLMTFVYVGLFLEFSQCRYAEKSSILSNFSKKKKKKKKIELKYTAYITC